MYVGMRALLEYVLSSGQKYIWIQYIRLAIEQFYKLGKPDQLLSGTWAFAEHGLIF